MIQKLGTEVTDRDQGGHQVGYYCMYVNIYNFQKILIDLVLICLS